MTRRERILTALRGKRPDRPPIAFDAHGTALNGALRHYDVADRNDLYAAAGIDGFSVWDWPAVMGRYAAPLPPSASGDLVEIGVDCWNPFPEYVNGNDHGWLREWRRGRLALDGGVSHLVLVQGAPDDVRDETRRVLDMFSQDGGLLIGPAQVFTEDMPTRNIVAFFEAALGRN